LDKSFLAQQKHGWLMSTLFVYAFLHNYLKPHCNLSNRSLNNWIKNCVPPAMSFGVAVVQYSLHEVLTFFNSKLVKCPDFNIVGLNLLNVICFKKILKQKNIRIIHAQLGFPSGFWPAMFKGKYPLVTTIR